MIHACYDGVMTETPKRQSAFNLAMIAHSTLCLLHQTIHTAMTEIEPLTQEYTELMIINRAIDTAASTVYGELQLLAGPPRRVADPEDLYIAPDTDPRPEELKED